MTTQNTHNALHTEPAYIIASTKVCTKCHTKKSTKEFSPNPANKDGFQYRCKECIFEIRKFRRENFVRVRR